MLSLVDASIFREANNETSRMVHAGIRIVAFREDGEPANPRGNRQLFYGNPGFKRKDTF